MKERTWEDTRKKMQFLRWQKEIVVKSWWMGGCDLPFEKGKENCPHCSWAAGVRLSRETVARNMWMTRVQWLGRGLWFPRLRCTETHIQHHQHYTRGALLQWVSEPLDPGFCLQWGGMRLYREGWKCSLKILKFWTENRMAWVTGMFVSSCTGDKRLERKPA